MNRLVALASLVLSLAAVADSHPPGETVELTAQKITLRYDRASVIRTNKTPETVELVFRVPQKMSVCERYETRHVLRPSGIHCGYDVIERRVPAGRVCARTNPHNGDCLRYEETFRIERVQRERICPVPETYCAQYGTQNTWTSDEMKIQFKDLPALGDSERESFSIVARQKAYDSNKVIYEVETLSTLRDYKIRQKKVLFYKRDFFVVEEK
jgi:hypothetical protein